MVAILMDTVKNPNQPPIQSMQSSAKDNHLLATTFLKSSCSKIPGVGPKMQERLAGLGLFSLQDLLWHFPRDFEDRRRLDVKPVLRFL